MGIKSFIQGLKKDLGLKTTKNGKKISIENLLKKLKLRKEKLDKTETKKMDKKEKKELKEELAIITLQIKKGEKILDEFNSKK